MSHDRLISPESIASQSPGSPDAGSPAQDASAPLDFARLYANFQAPIAAFDCGMKCAPHNEGGLPFCCDIRHAVPVTYRGEWEYLQPRTDLWRPWEGETAAETESLLKEIGQGQALLACLGPELCQRGFRSLTCRAFPFFPYLNKQGVFLGLSYYWEYADRCWIISNLHVVTAEYRSQFMAAFEALFAALPEERENYLYHSKVMRRLYRRRRKAIPLLHRNGNTYKITAYNERMRRVDPRDLPKFGPYEITSQLLFPDEIGEF